MKRSPRVMRFFDGYVRRLLARRFHRVHLWSCDVPLPTDRPLLFAMSHASWWDVLVGYHLARTVLRRDSVAPMDAAQLDRYRVLGRLGLYGVDRGTRAGHRRFLADTLRHLDEGRAVWLTPQGEIASARRRPVRFQAGIGHLLHHRPQSAVIPVAVAYEFLEEPRPEIFIRLGVPRLFAGRPAAREATRVAERDLEQMLDSLETALVRRDLTAFTPLLEGATSVSLVYDRVRALRRWWTGRPDPARHGDLVSDPRRRGP